jgi:hypothetical protein
MQDNSTFCTSSDLCLWEINYVVMPTSHVLGIVSSHEVEQAKRIKGFGRETALEPFDLLELFGFVELFL